MALYVYGLLKHTFFHPNPAIPLNSTALDNIADIGFKVNSMNPEEVVPMLYPQIYQVSNVNLDENELPEVSKIVKVIVFRLVAITTEKLTEQRRDLFGFRLAERHPVGGS